MDPWVIISAGLAIFAVLGGIALIIMAKNPKQEGKSMVDEPKGTVDDVQAGAEKVTGLLGWKAWVVGLGVLVGAAFVIYLLFFK